MVDIVYCQGKTSVRVTSELPSKPAAATAKGEPAEMNVIGVDPTIANELVEPTAKSVISAMPT